MKKSNRIDISGQKYGKLLVLRYTKTFERYAYWECLCDCGNIVEARGNSLRMGLTKSCGCLRTGPRSKLKNDLVGKKFSHLTVLFRHKESKRVKYVCKCDCGNECVVSSDKLSSGHTKSCGCLLKKKSSERAIKRNQKMRGENHPRWRGDLTAKDRITLINNRFANPRLNKWRKKIFSRDRYTCRICNDSRGGNLQAHHIFSWDFYEKFRYLTKNGICLCQKCHVNFHKEHGYGNNTRKQFMEWAKKRGSTIITL